MSALTVVMMLMTMLLSGVGRGPVSAAVTGVNGSAYGYFSSVGLFGGPPSTTGPTPTVTLPAGGSASPITNTAATGSAIVGPARIFSSGRLDVSTQGTTGSGSSVTSSVSIQSINTSGQEPFTATSLSSSCAASASGITGSTTIAGGTLQTDSGNDVNGDGDFIDAGEHPPVTVALSANPAPNTTYDGHIHTSGSTDNFHYVVNEQIVNPTDGSITVNAAHESLLGPTAVGELIIGQAVCGVTASVDPSKPTVSITAPQPGARIKAGARITVAATAAGSAVQVVEMRSCRGTQCDFASGKTIGTATAAPYVITWRRQPKHGTYTLVAQATDVAGNTALSAPVTVRVKTHKK